MHGHGGRARRGSIAPEPRFSRDASLELVVARDLRHAAAHDDAFVWERRRDGRRRGRRVSPVHLEASQQRVPLRVRALDPGLGREIGLRRLGRGGESHGCAVEHERASAADAAHRRGRLRRLGHLEEPFTRDEPPRLLGVVVLAKVQRDEVARANVVEGSGAAWAAATRRGARTLRTARLGVRNTLTFSQVFTVPTEAMAGGSSERRARGGERRCGHRGPDPALDARPFGRDGDDEAVPRVSASLPRGGLWLPQLYPSSSSP